MFYTSNSDSTQVISIFQASFAKIFSPRWLISYFGFGTENGLKSVLFWKLDRCCVVEMFSAWAEPDMTEFWNNNLGFVYFDKCIVEKIRKYIMQQILFKEWNFYTTMKSCSVLNAEYIRCPGPTFESKSNFRQEVHFANCTCPAKKERRHVVKRSKKEDILEMEGPNRLMDNQDFFREEILQKFWRNTAAENCEKSWTAAGEKWQIHPTPQYRLYTLHKSIKNIR